MKAITVRPGTANSAQLNEMPEPPLSDGSVLVETHFIGVCGTDLEIITGQYGWAPPGQERLILGHESLGRVLEAPAGSGFEKGDWVVGIVRRPDPVPCSSCAVGEWDMCRNGKYTERGIKERHGYASERYRIEPEYLVKISSSLGSCGVLLEPASVLAKAWEQIDRIGSRLKSWQPRQALITGAGPVGLLAALMAKQRGLEVHVLDRHNTGPKPEMVQRLGGRYHTGPVANACRRPDIVVECTGVGQLVLDVMQGIAPDGIACLTGVSSGGRKLTVDASLLGREMVLENTVVFGSVNANRRHYEAGAQALARAERGWLESLITRQVPLSQWRDAYDRRADDIKAVIDFKDFKAA